MADTCGTSRRCAGLALTLTLVAGPLIGVPEFAAAQTVRDVFQKVAPSVVVIRATGRDVTSGGQTRFSETGSGVLVSQDGQVMTAAHVVHAMDEIKVEFLRGETVPARVVSCDTAADLTLLPLELLPSGSKVAPMAGSRTA